MIGIEPKIVTIVLGVSIYGLGVSIYGLGVYLYMVRDWRGKKSYSSLVTTTKKVLNKIF